MTEINDKAIDRLFSKMDSIQAQISENNSQQAVNSERQLQTSKDIICIHQNIEKNHHRLRCANEKMVKDFNETLQGIKDRMTKIEGYSKSPSIIGQFITRNKMALSGTLVALILAIVEAGRMLYKMPPPH